MPIRRLQLRPTALAQLASSANPPYRRLRVEARSGQSGRARGIVSSLMRAASAAVSGRAVGKGCRMELLKLGEHVDAEKYKADVFPDVLDVMRGIRGGISGNWDIAALFQFTTAGVVDELHNVSTFHSGDSSS